MKIRAGAFSLTKLNDMKWNALVQYFKGWNLMRAIRFGIGIAIVIQGIQTHELMFTILGALFSLLAVFNLGCNSVSCATPATRKKDYSGRKTETIHYEEVQ